MGWPAYCREALTVGDPASCVGVCTLWTPRRRIADALPPGSYAAVGNLYSREGISLLLRNLLANPRVRHLVLCGADLSGTGAALVRLLTDGVGPDHRVRGDGTAIDRALPVSAIDRVRDRLVLHDRRGDRGPASVRALIDGLRSLPPLGRPRLYPRPEPAAERFPAEETGVAVRAPSIAEAWLRMVAAVIRFGLDTATADGGWQRELLGLVAVVEQEDPDDPQLPEWLGVDRRALDRYAAQVIGRDAVGAAYSYGRRLRAFRGHDQVAALVSELTHHPESRRAVAVLWAPAVDAGGEHPPCLIALQARRRAGRLHLVANFRSSDVYRAWPLNAFALRRLQALLAAGTGADLGHLVTTAGSAHVYAECWPAAADLLRGQGDRLERVPRFVRDPRGSFVIRVETDGLAVDHYAPEGALLATHHGPDAAAVGRTIAPFISLTSHALYLGGELARAETARRRGLPYVQDEPPVD